MHENQDVDGYKASELSKSNDQLHAWEWQARRSAGFFASRLRRARNGSALAIVAGIAAGAAALRALPVSESEEMQALFDKTDSMLAEIKTAAEAGNVEAALSGYDQLIMWVAEKHTHIAEQFPEFVDAGGETLSSGQVTTWARGLLGL